MGNLNEMLERMKEGVTDYTNEDGTCSGCGACCSCLLPLSDTEEKFLRRFVKKYQIKPMRAGVGMKEPVMDLTCPFLDSRLEHKCRIYNARPQICRSFQCNQSPAEIEANKALFWEQRHGVNMWDLFKKEK